MTNKKGFTLIELLIAAVIIGTLAILATQSFRNASSDIRIEDMKARAKLVAMAGQHFLLDRRSLSPDNVDTSDMSVVTDPRGINAAPCSNTELSLQNLVNCGFLEYRQYAAEIREDNQFKSNFRMRFDMDKTNSNRIKELWVCLLTNSSKITTDLSMIRALCTNGEVWENRKINQI